MGIALLFLGLQLHAPLSAGAQRAVMPMADSAKIVNHAHAAQVAFERSRRTLLPPGQSSGGSCDVRLGRFCWWYDGGLPHFPPENSTIGVRRAELLAELDSASALHPGDDWLVGMRVHYRIDGKEFARADSAARSCRASGWWCAALIGYAAHSRGDVRVADSAFAAAASAMSSADACAWLSIAPLLSGDRDEYEKLPCDARSGIERRYWMLSRPRFGTGANEWRNEFNTRRVITWLGARAATPHLISWGDDAAELVLRYGWPVAWSRVESYGANMGSTEPSIIGHDPSPSFPFAARAPLKDSLLSLGPESWNLTEIRAESRYAPPGVRRVGNVAAQFARFKRGDSTLIVGIFAAHDDSLRTASATLGAVTFADSVFVSAPDSHTVGRLRVMSETSPALVGIDVADSSTGTLLRTRYTFAPLRDSISLTVSDLLVYRPGEEPPSTLDSAMAHAIPGDTAARNQPIGLFWETYGLPPSGTALDVTVSVERVDRGWIRSTRQRLGLTPIDTPIRMKWSDARPATGRGVSLDVTNLDAGRYRVTLTLTQEGAGSVSSVREVELINP